MKLLILAVCLLATGCETTRQFAHEHPVATGIGIAVLAGSIAASVNHGDHQQGSAGAISGPQKPPCTIQPDGSCR